MGRRVSVSEILLLRECGREGYSLRLLGKINVWACSEVRQYLGVKLRDEILGVIGRIPAVDALSPQNSC